MLQVDIHYITQILHLELSLDQLRRLELVGRAVEQASPGKSFFLVAPPQNQRPDLADYTRKAKLVFVA